MDSLPSGTVTFLFTDIEGSTRLLQRLGDRYEPLLAAHHRLLREAFEAHGGTEVETAGDSLFVTFPSARAALLAAVAAQRSLLGHEWPEGAEVRVRMGLHTGEPVSGEVGFVGLDVHRAARICAAGHGGQIVVSRTTRDLGLDGLPAELQLLDLGEHALKDLTSPERLFQVVAPGLRRDFPPLRTIAARPHNLPRQLTSFIGRQHEIAAAKRILASTPLLTLTGPGGVGKTRLSLEVAAELLDDLEDGAWFVELGSLTDPAFVTPTLATVLGISEQPGRPLLATLVEHLRGRQMLLVFDNCEHVLDASAEVADAILRACREVQLIATSREGLGVPGEALLPVPSLSLPEAGSLASADELEQFESVRLFVERAMAGSPSFRVTNTNAQHVIQICRRLDGVPLAIELAAARVRAITVDQIAARLDDRFRLLTGSSRITVPRHQTLRQTIDWSYDLLVEEERAVFRRASVFAGGFTLEAAEEICAGGDVMQADVLELLSRLVDKSLVLAEAAVGAARYRLLETIRQYARDQLLESGEAMDALRRHRDWCLALVEQARPEFLQGQESGSWLERLDREHENLRAALQWSDDEPGERRAGLRLAEGLWRFWEIRGHLIEGRAWLERMLSAAGPETSELRANALTGAGILAFMQGDYAAASAFHEESLALRKRLGDRDAISYAINNLANTAVLLGEYGRARQLYEQGLAMAQEMGDPYGSGFGLINMADVVAREGDYAGARSRFEQGLAAFRQLGDRWAEAFALDSFAAVASRQGDLTSAEALGAQALAISRSLGDERGAARALGHLAEVAGRRGDVDRAKAMCRESLAIRRGLGDAPGIVAALENLAGIVMADDPEAAARLLGSAEALRESIHALVPPSARADHEERLRSLRDRLDEGRLTAALERGRAMSPDEAAATILP